MRLELAVKDAEKVEAGTAAHAPGVGRDAKEAALGFVIVVVDGREEEVDEFDPEVGGWWVFDFGAEELLVGAGGAW